MIRTESERLAAPEEFLSAMWFTKVAANLARNGGSSSNKTFVVQRSTVGANGGRIDHFQRFGPHLLEWSPGESPEADLWITTDSLASEWHQYSPTVGITNVPKLGAPGRPDSLMAPHPLDMIGVHFLNGHDISQFAVRLVTADSPFGPLDVALQFEGRTVRVSDDQADADVAIAVPWLYSLAARCGLMSLRDGLARGGSVRGALADLLLADSILTDDIFRATFPPPATGRAQIAFGRIMADARIREVTWTLAVAGLR